MTYGMGQICSGLIFLVLDIPESRESFRLDTSGSTDTTAYIAISPVTFTWLFFVCKVP